MAKETETQALTRQVRELRAEVSKLKDLLHTKDNWPSFVRENRGKEFALVFIDGTELEGVLRWSDRYTICIQTERGETIVSKGAVAMLWVKQ